MNKDLNQHFTEDVCSGTRHTQETDAGGSPVTGQPEPHSKTVKLPQNKQDMRIFPYSENTDGKLSGYGKFIHCSGYVKQCNHFGWNWQFPKKLT